MEIKTCILTQNDCYKAGKTIRPQGIMVHSTGANNPRLKRYVGPDDGLLGKNDYGNHWNRSGVEACAHAFIGLDKNGTVQVYQTLPWTMRAWHCGAEANDTHIAFEICEDGLTDRAYFEATRDAAIALCVSLCRQFHLDPTERGVLIDHKEGWEQDIASNHGDIRHWWGKFGYTMYDFREAVRKALAEPALTWEAVREMIEAAQPKVYHSPEEIPAWGKEAVQALVDRGVLRGVGGGDLKLTEDVLRMLVFLRREKIL